MEPICDVNDKISFIIDSIRCFYLMMRSSDWLLKTERKEIKDCILSARDLERVFEELQNIDAAVNFERMLQLDCPDYSKSISLSKACNAVLEKVLTAPGVPYNTAKFFFEDYIEICGVERFAAVLSSSVFQSEVYRVILDFIAGSTQKLKMGVLFEARILSCIWQQNSSLENFENFWEDWMKQDTSGHNIAVIMRIIADSHASETLASSLTSLLVAALDRRTALALQFCQTILADPDMICALASAELLLDALLDFLRSSGQWMEATETMEWISRESGPCHTIGFAKIVSALQNLLSSEKEIITHKTKAFLSQQRIRQGCTFWDDVYMKLTFPNSSSR